jgi:myo-inositol 2-dehydrogenase/D-chiro-inositol 1-dehydrogenase
VSGTASAAPLRIGLIGTGRIGQVHAGNIAASPDAVLQWVCDAIPASAEATATAFGARATTDSREIFTAGDVDAVLVASPTPTHVDLIAAALDAGLPVLCEKPIDLDIARSSISRSRVAIPIHRTRLTSGSRAASSGT